MYNVVFKSLKIIKERKDWWAARTHCEEIGGKLFSDLDGSLDQLNTLFNLQNMKTFWLGLERTGIGKIQFCSIIRLSAVMFQVSK